MTCQICDKPGHPTNECWWHYEDDEDYIVERGEGMLLPPLTVLTQIGITILLLLITS